MLAVHIELTRIDCRSRNVGDINVLLCVIYRPAGDGRAAGNDRNLAGNGLICDDMAVLARVGRGERDRIADTIGSAVQPYRHITACTQRCSSGFCLFNRLEGGNLRTGGAVAAVDRIDPERLRICGIGSDTESGKYADKHDKRQEQGNCFFHGIISPSSKNLHTKRAG